VKHAGLCSVEGKVGTGGDTRDTWRRSCGNAGMLVSFGSPDAVSRRYGSAGCFVSLGLHVVVVEFFPLSFGVTCPLQ
jgi:hypothetical protein